jgi:pimeloyl-ACP methyl ester carboxylesterase
MSMIMAVQRPESLQGIIMNDIGPEIDPIGYARILAYAGRQGAVSNWQDAALQCSQTYGLAIPDKSLEFWESYVRRNYVESENGAPVPDVDPNVGEAIRRGAKAIKVLTWMRKLGLLRYIQGVPIDPWDSFRAVSMPCLVLRGAISDILSEEIIDRMVQVKPDLQRVTIPNRGHTPMLDETEALQAIDAFLLGLQRESS